MQRICSRCGKKKNIKEFNFKNKDKKVWQYHCKDCSRLYVRSHYLKNRDYYLAKARKRNLENKITIKKYIWDYFTNHPCVDCGETDPIVLEFDHLSDKIVAVSEMHRNFTLSKVIKEIEKCQVRCANCYRRRTAKVRGWNKKFPAPVA